MRLPHSFIALALCALASAHAQTGVTASLDGPRKMIPLSGTGWKFLGGGETDTLPEIDSAAYKSAAWTPVSVPHTFQNRTDMSTEQGWYRTKITAPKGWARSHFYLVFEGAADIADVYVNGRRLGQHRGGFTRFVFDATAALHPGGENELAVLVDIRPGEIKDCLPNESDRTNLYTVWGGLYRRVWLLVTNDLQIDPEWYASPGVFITPGNVTAQSAGLSVKVLLRNAASAGKTAKIKATILDPGNRRVGVLSGGANLAANEKTSVTLSGTVADPLLWSPATPNLYHVKVDLYDAGQLADSVTQPLGFHSIVWDLQKGTLKVNGKPFVLEGASMHQETEKKDSAVDPGDLIANYDTLKDLGVNFVRLVHYPKAQLEYDECDQRGLFCWAENGHSHHGIVSPTADCITTEMVMQNYNHPSIIIWSVGNEGNLDVAAAEAPVVKALDSTRPVMVAQMDKCPAVDYHAKNQYPGWYGGDRWTFKPAGCFSEIGAGGVVTTHTDYATARHVVDHYEPEEYQQLVAEAHFEQVFRRSKPDTLGMFCWWLLRDITDHKYKKDEAPLHHGLNTKGLLTYSGDRKDIYYLYRSFLRPNVPTLHIASKRYFLRQGAVDNGIKVYSNAKTVTLALNGETVSTMVNGQYAQPPEKGINTEVDNVFYWPVPLHTGKNIVTVRDSNGAADSATIYFEGANGLPELPVAHPLVRNLTSSNPSNPAYYMDMPVQPQWPVYYDLDSTADNSLDLLPDAVQGATWLALRRVTKPGEATDVSFTLSRAATVSVLCTRQDPDPASLTSAGFTPVNCGVVSWRDNDMILRPAALYSRHYSPGESVKISLGDRDALVLFKAG